MSGARSAATVAVRVKPGARGDRVGGCHPGPHGPAVVIEVRARPVGGAATDAARRLLAGSLGVPPSAVALRAGAHARDKLFRVSDPPEDLRDRVARLLAGEA